MATKRTNPKGKGESKSVGGTEENIIEREAFDWGVRLTAAPFKGTANHDMVIRSEIRNYRPGRGSEVYITFPAASLQKPLRLIDAQTWYNAMGAIIRDTRTVQTEMRTAAAGKKR